MWPFAFIVGLPNVDFVVCGTTTFDNSVPMHHYVTSYDLRAALNVHHYCCMVALKKP